MKPDVTLSKLEDAATQLGVKVSYEVLGAAVGLGGLCKVKGEFRVIIDKRASTEERVTTLAGSLAGVLRRLEGIEIDPKVRNLIDFHAPGRTAPSRAA